MSVAKAPKKRGMKSCSCHEDDDGFECCAQWSFMIVNLPVALMGVALIVLGALTVSERNFLEALNLGSTSLYVGIASAMILSGIVLLVLAVGGTVAAFREHRPSLIVYYAVAAVVFLLLCIVVMLGFVYRMKISEHLRHDLMSSVPDYDPDRSAAPATSAWDRMQAELKCCGVADSNGDGSTTVAPAYSVWKNNIRLNSGSAESRVPRSCCLSSGSGGAVTDCDQDEVVDPSRVWTADCFDAAAAYLQGHVAMLCVICAVFGAILVVAAAFSIGLYYLADI